MADIVFVLGAGASKKAGAPLMPEFLDTAHRLWRLEQVGAAGSEYERVFRAISHLQRVHSKATLDIQNVESVFAAFDMAVTLGRFLDYPVPEITELGVAMRRLIARTIELTVKYHYSKERGLRPPEPYESFAKLIGDLKKEAKPSRTVALLTFNYDLGLDYSLYRGQIRSGYGFDAKGSKEGLVPLLKLHGSINWFKCAECETVCPWTAQDIFQQLSISPFAEPGLIPLELSPHIDRHKHCDKPVMPDAVLVPPTWNKTEHHRQLSAVWSLASKELSEAEALVLIGYSLPESDAFFRYLYALGAVGEIPLKLFLVINPDVQQTTRERFESLLGPGARQRFAYWSKPFETSLKELREVLENL